MMRSLLCRQSDSYGLSYGEAPRMAFEEAPVKKEIAEPVYVSQIEQMRIEWVEPDQFSMDELDREELRRMESRAVRQLAPLIRREVDRMTLEGNILGDESVDGAHIQRAIENVMEQIGQDQRPGGYLEDLVGILLLNEIFDRRRRCRRRGNCR